MELRTAITPTACGRPLDVSADAFGWLRASDPEACDLPQRLQEDGYLFLPGLLDRERVRAARLELLGVAAEHGALDPAHPVEDGVLRARRRRRRAAAGVPRVERRADGAAPRPARARLLRRHPRRRGAQLRLHVAAGPDAWIRRGAALRRRLHEPRDARRAHLLDAVRRHRAGRRRPDAAGGLPPQVRPAARRLPRPGRRHLLRERPQRRGGAERRDALGALGPRRRPGATGAARSPTTRSRCASGGAAAGSPRRSSGWETC